MAKKLKDVNKDGKVNFKDTWLGERLSTKGKLKGPNLAESLKGARREVPGEEKKSTTSTKPSASIKPESSQKKNKVTATAKASGSVVPTGTASAKATVKVPSKPESKSTTGEPLRTALKSVGPIGGMVSRLQVRPSASPDRTDRKITKDTSGVTYEQWKNMTRTERRDRGLPVSPIGGELAFNRFLSGITGKDYKVGGEATVKKPKMTVKVVPGTYSKGGMTKGKK
jgi:hypothetical protein